MKFYHIIVFTFCFHLIGRGDVIPKHNGTVHYTDVYFEENFQKKAVDYELHVFTDSLSLIKDSAAYVQRNKFPAFRIEGLTWGKLYLWRVKSFNAKNKMIGVSETHKFTIIQKVRSPFFYDVKVDVRTNKATKHAGGFIVIDYLKGIYNREGVPVWLLPSIPGVVEEGTEIRDLKFTSDNTLTYLSNHNPIEMDLEGNILWRPASPFIFDNDTIMFHHDLKKTKQGSYLLLGNRTVLRKVLSEYDPNTPNSKREREHTIINGVLYAKTEVAVVLELDKEGKVLWFWDSNEYLKDEDLNFRRAPDGFPFLQSHANALGANDENTKIYIGFRDLSRIIKIDKQTKKVELSYGQKYPSGEAQYAVNLFKQQHDAKPTNRGTILIFNNNGPRGNFGVSSILELKDNPNSGDSVVQWQFNLDFDTLSKGRSGSAGNVNELPGNNILLCGGQLNRIFEVTKNKEVVWDAFIKSLDKKDSLWHPMPNYRCSWVGDVYQGHILTGEVQFRKHKKNVLKVEFTIYNISNQAEDYQVELFSDTHQSLYRNSTAHVGKDQSLNHMLEVALKDPETNNLTLVLSTKTLPIVTKRIKIELEHGKIKK